MRNVKSVVLVVAAALAAVAAGVGYAAIPAGNGTISACVDSRGRLNVIDAEAGQTCGGGKQQLDWNQMGPAGPAGPTGPQGETGPAGPEGSPGPSAIDFATTASGGGPNPSSTTQFFAAPVLVTVPTTTSRVLVVAQNGFGAGGLGGNSLNLFVCYKQQGFFSPITPVGSGIVGLSLPPSTRVPMGINKVLTLAPGTYQVGMCGTGGVGWTNNDWGTTTAIVFEVD